ncbi:MAG TPA: hypothetical protein VHM88_22785, partial [Candidatus Acidoferrales bacterium]|nr:hypothetical protein [Candidatus Acidoferrales bacterium]
MRRIVLLSLLLCVPPVFAQTDVLTQRNDNLRTGQNLNETTLTPSNVKAATFGKLFAFSVDGQVYAQPLYKSNVSIPGQGIHNVVYVATEHDSVYAFDADGQTTTPLWQVSFINPAANIVPASNADVGADDIRAEIGITGTPVIDPATGTLYVVARTKESGTHFQRLHALDIATGAEKFGGPVVIQATLSGSNGSVVFDPLRHLQRPGLVLANNTVYVGFASHGDVTPYHGWVMAYNATTLQQVAAYTTTLNGVQGGIWMSGAGLAADPSGNIYFSVGNGDFDGLTNFGDSCVKLSTTTGLTLSDYFAPFNQSALTGADLDVSSGGVTLLPDAAGSAAHPHLMVVAGKDGTIYVLDRDHMGGFNSSTSNPDSQIVQEIWNALGGTPIDVTQPTLQYVDNNFDTAAYWQNKVYWGGAGDHIKMFTLSNGLLSTKPASQSPTSYAGNRGASPVVSANGATNAIVWAIESATNAVLHAYDATNLANELYNSNQAAASRDVPGPPVIFAVPTVTNGKVYVGTQSQVVVYGLLGST